MGGTYDLGSTTEDKIFSINVLANDGGGKGRTLTGVSSTKYSAALTWKADGTVTYDPTKAAQLQALDDGEGRVDTFTYTFKGSSGKTDTVTSYILVKGVNDAPVGTADSATVAEDTTAGITINVLKNDTDPDKDPLNPKDEPLKVTNLSTNSANGGALSLNPDGTVKYVPPANFVGDDTFTYTPNDGTVDGKPVTVTVTVTNVNDLPTGAVTITGTAKEDQVLTASNTLGDEDGMGAVTYQWQRGGQDITGATNGTYQLTQADVGKAITVIASYTDGQSTKESKTSAATDPVANVNDLPTGAVTITGTAKEDQVLTASNTLGDEDGMGAVTYQWQRGGQDITGATNGTYQLTQADVGKAITVIASYTDGQGTKESKTSAATDPVANVNDLPTGAVTITGTAKEDQVLTASNTLGDEDGMGAVTYQWQRGGQDITGATNGTYQLTQADVGKAITVIASYTDGQSTKESKTSAATDPVANVNDLPTGAVTITGTAKEDQVLTASNTLGDEDGMGVVTYQWQRGGQDITGATNGTYQLTQADVGKAITVIASYTDGQSTKESKTSAATDPVANVNDLPTGAVTITGTAKEDQVLTASNTLGDEDGMGAVTYQWQRGGQDITGATNGTYQLTQADVGKAITVIASYTDGQGTKESKTSAATDPVANVNDLPTGAVTITGTAKEDQVLTASNTLGDEDVMGTVSYQWQRDGQDIDGAVNGTYQLTQDDVGSAITVVASYTDGQGTKESKTSAATDPVANVNDLPTGAVTITGTAKEDQVLTASNTLGDEDVMGMVTSSAV